MIVVDTSVWIDFFNGRETPHTLALKPLLGEQPVLVGDLILCELLQGARSEEHARALERELRKFDIVSMLDDSISVAASRNYRRLRDKGITVRKTIDLIIGSFCIAHDHTLLHADRDFEAMEQHLGLKTLQVGWSIHEGP